MRKLRPRSWTDGEDTLTVEPSLTEGPPQCLLLRSNPINPQLPPKRPPAITSATILKLASHSAAFPSLCILIQKARKFR